MPLTLSQNWAAIQKKILSQKVTIVGVTKGQAPEKIQQALQAGVQVLGNNYVQEGERLRKQVGEARWHFIGHIQSRKVRQLLDYDCIQSIDRLSIVEELHTRLEKIGKSIDALIEVNIGQEASKSGVAPEEVERFTQSCLVYSRVRIRGLMVMPPPLFPIENRRPFFQRARAIFDRYNAMGWDCLSMGTSEDYELAIEEGSTMIRLGTVLFGPRT
jgi:pyridoxal phosphate enzyme (YggS family)